MRGPAAGLASSPGHSAVSLVREIIPGIEGSGWRSCPHTPTSASTGSDFPRLVQLDLAPVRADDDGIADGIVPVIPPFRSGSQGPACRRECDRLVAGVAQRASGMAVRNHQSRRGHRPINVAKMSRPFSGQAQRIAADRPARGRRPGDRVPGPAVLAEYLHGDRQRLHADPARGARPAAVVHRPPARGRVEGRPVSRHRGRVTRRPHGHPRIAKAPWPPVVVAGVSRSVVRPRRPPQPRSRAGLP